MVTAIQFLNTMSDHVTYLINQKLDNVHVIKERRPV